MKGGNGCLQWSASYNVIDRCSGAMCMWMMLSRRLFYLTWLYILASVAASGYETLQFVG